MDYWGETNWFAVQSKPHQENMAAARVARLDVEVFLPRIRQEQLVCGATRTVTKPLFAGYFFARFSPLLGFDAVRYAQGVLRVVGTKRLPIPLEAEIISAIRHRIQADGFIQLEAKPLRLGDRVTIDQGPLAGWMGRVELEWDDGKRVMILLEAIETARLLVEKRWLTLACDAV
jgi:transcriptional antiterminator RfaH